MRTIPHARTLSLMEAIKMIAKQRAITTYEDVIYDETLGYGRNNAGAYFLGEELAPVEDIRAVAVAYLQQGARIPPEFPEIRAIVAGILA